MALLWDLLWLASAILAIGLCLLIAWAVCYQFFTTEVPPGICQPLKIRILHVALSAVFALVSYLKLFFKKTNKPKSDPVTKVVLEGSPVGLQKNS